MRANVIRSASMMLNLVVVFVFEPEAAETAATRLNRRSLMQQYQSTSSVHSISHKPSSESSVEELHSPSDLAFDDGTCEQNLCIEHFKATESLFGATYLVCDEIVRVCADEDRIEDCRLHGNRKEIPTNTYRLNDEAFREADFATYFDIPVCVSVAQTYCDPYPSLLHNECFDDIYGTCESFVFDSCLAQSSDILSNLSPDRMSRHWLSVYFQTVQQREPNVDEYAAVFGSAALVHSLLQSFRFYRVKGSDVLYRQDVFSGEVCWVNDLSMLTRDGCFLDCWTTYLPGAADAPHWLTTLGMLAMEASADGMKYDTVLGNPSQVHNGACYSANNR